MLLRNREDLYLRTWRIGLTKARIPSYWVSRNAIDRLNQIRDKEDQLQLICENEHTVRGEVSVSIVSIVGVEVFPYRLVEEFLYPF